MQPLPRDRHRQKVASTVHVVRSHGLHASGGGAVSRWWGRVLCWAHLHDWWGLGAARNPMSLRHNDVRQCLRCGELDFLALR